jgi:hypothetical protein
MPRRVSQASRNAYRGQAARSTNPSSQLYNHVGNLLSSRPPRNAPTTSRPVRPGSR